MRYHIIQNIARHSYRVLMQQRMNQILIGLCLSLGLWSLYANHQQGVAQEQSVRSHQREVRKEWEANPDKHPHRMAHYGYIAFRMRHPLAFFDPGLEPYTGNAVFLEAHRQNTVNLSEASFSTGILRLGLLSPAFVLKTLVLLLLFFWGFRSIAADRESGTLAMLLAQGVTWPELILGHTVGLLGMVSWIFVPLMLLSLPFLSDGAGAATFQRWALLMAGYAIFLVVGGWLAVLVSARSDTARGALTVLIGLWALWVIVLPRTSQAMGQYWFPAPVKVAFDAAIEAELIEQGDSHDPDDPHYKMLKDSVLRSHGVDNVEQLPFNYSGFVMREGERISSEIYNRHYEQLLKRFRQQEAVTGWTAWLNPFTAISQVSMALSGTDVAAYTDFQQQAERYRYALAQQMNEWQIQFISNKKLDAKAKPYFISKSYWQQFPDFEYRFLPVNQSLRQAWMGIGALLIWLLALLGFTLFHAKTTSLTL